VVVIMSPLCAMPVPFHSDPASTGALGKLDCLRYPLPVWHGGTQPRGWVGKEHTHTLLMPQLTGTGATTALSALGVAYWGTQRDVPCTCFVCWEPQAWK
jgi:hypothetical protein